MEQSKIFVYNLCYQRDKRKYNNCNKKYEKTLLYDSGELKEKYVFSNKSDYLSNKSYDAYFYYKNGNLELVTTIREGKRENNENRKFSFRKRFYGRFRYG